MDGSKVQIAARVLTVMTQFRDPDFSDVKLLRTLAETDEERQMPLDELARIVIMREIRRRRQARQDDHNRAA
jgi:hypothetical protein